MELAGQKVLVIGLKRTGTSTALFLTRCGASVRAADRQSAAALGREVTALADKGVELRLEEENRSLLNDVDLVIPSPGVPRTSSLLSQAVYRSIPVLSEAEIAFRFLRFPLIAITGTNGKSTTTSLLGEMFRQAGKRVFVGGNLGTPLIEAVAGDYEVGVAEVSSFQLEWVEAFRPTIGLLLNLTADHLDRYSNFAEYTATKKSLFARQTAQDYAVLNREDPAVWALAGELPSQVTSFGWEKAKQGTFIRRGYAVFRGPQGEEVFSLKRLRLCGRHNIENVMAALTAARLWGLEKEVVQQTLEGFSGLAHRLEFIAEKKGVRYFDDSKGTNVGAVVKSLESFTGEVILLAGGLDKGGDYTPLKTPVRQRVKKLFLFGQAREKIYLTLKDETEVNLVNSLEEAVSAAAARAKPGDTILLSPACASFDMFTDYTHRGRVFRAAVERL